jgi:hypothetical protein
VIHYIQAMGTVSPKIEGRLAFIYDLDAPTITITSPMAKDYTHPEFLTIDFTVTDVGPAGIGPGGVMADLDGVPVKDGDVIDLFTLVLGPHTLTVHAVDRAGNASHASVKFNVIATPQSLMDAVKRFYDEGKITNAGVNNSLMQKLDAYMKLMMRGQMKTANNILMAFVNEVMAQRGKHITMEAADLLIQDAMWVMEHP